MISEIEIRVDGKIALVEVLDIESFSDEQLAWIIKHMLAALRDAALDRATSELKQPYAIGEVQPGPDLGRSVAALTPNPLAP